MKGITCEKIANGKMCNVPDISVLNDIMLEHSLLSNTVNEPNGTRVVLSKDDGSWFGTAIKYKGNDGFLLFKSN